MKYTFIFFFTLAVVNVAAQNDPLYVVNGAIQPTNDSVFKKINPSSIFSIEVLTDRKSFKRYGERGKNGAILIVTYSKKPKKIWIHWAWPFETTLSRRTGKEFRRYRRKDRNRFRKILKNNA